MTSWPSSSTEIFFAIARPGLLTTVLLASVLLFKVMLKARPRDDDVVLSKIRKANGQDFFHIDCTRVFVTTMLWRLPFTPYTVQAKNCGSSFLAKVAIFSADAAC